MRSAKSWLPTVSERKIKRNTTIKSATAVRGLLMNYDLLFSPAKIGNVTVKNRIIMEPMCLGFGQFDGRATDTMMDYYEERAKGGRRANLYGDHPCQRHNRRVLLRSTGYES